MAKSRSESPLRGAFALLSLRGAKGDEAISKDSPRGENDAWPGQNTIATSEIPRFTRNKLRNLKMGSLK
jgi:hypothetical protein